MEKEIQEKSIAREAEAVRWPVAATVTSCVILNAEGELLHSELALSGTAPGAVAYSAVMRLQELLDVQRQLGDPPAGPLKALLFGLQVRDNLRIMALDALRYARVENLLVPSARFWAHRTFEPGIYADPYEVLVPAERRNDVGLDELLRFLGISYSDASPGSAYSQAYLARLLTVNTGLLV